MEADEALLRLDYDQTTQFLRAFTDVRIKLLAFVPTISGAAVGLLGRPRPAAELLGVALLGLVATFGILVHDLQNADLYDAMIRRAQAVERLLGLPTVEGLQGAGSVLGARSGRWFAYGRGSAFVYSAALGGWSYLAAWGFLSWIQLDGARTIAAVIGIAAGVLVAAGIERFEPGAA